MSKLARSYSEIINDKHEYADTIEKWEKQFNVKLSLISGIMVSRSMLFCAKCKQKRKLQRHHKGSEFFLACVRPDLYAVRYLEFRSGDVVRICSKCHERVHDRYKLENIAPALWLLIKDRYPKTIRPRVLARFRLKFVKVCDKWLAGDYDIKLKPRRKRKKKWEHQHQ